MEIRDDGVLVMKSSQGIGRMFMSTEGPYLRIETTGVMFLDDDKSAELRMTMRLYRSTGRLPGIGK